MLLEDRHLQAAFGQQRRGAETADARANDDDIMLLIGRWTSIELRCRPFVGLASVDDPLQGEVRKPVRKER